MLVEFTEEGLPTRQYRVSRELLGRDSAKFKGDLVPKDTRALTMCDYRPDIFELFLLWIHTKHYEELDTTVEALYCDDYPGYNSLASRNDGVVMPWRVKAAIQAIIFATSYRAPKFQNYAMKRLLCAYSRIDPANKVTDSLWIYIDDTESDVLKKFCQDVVIRNWGDWSMVVKDDDYLTECLGEDEEFRARFVEAIGTPLAERQALPFKIGDYLVPEE